MIAERGAKLRESNEKEKNPHKYIRHRLADWLIRKQGTENRGRIRMTMEVARRIVKKKIREGDGEKGRDGRRVDRIERDDGAGREARSG
jgi:hypothetical protein